MSKRKKGRHKKRGPTVSGPWASTYWHLRRLASDRNLFVLFDGEPAAPRITIFDTIRGMALLDYWPKSHLWSYADRPGRGGQCAEHGDIIALAVRIAGTRGRADRDNSDLSHFGTGHMGRR
jgi:hypothetical protein